ncbi:MAG: sulfotransferase, partial [Cyanobacteria bacterium J06558_2]
RGVISPVIFSWLSVNNEKYQEKITGDITPLYYQLPESEIKYIKDLLPDLKIIILLRNPIDRAWSKAKMNLCQHQGRKLKDISQEEFYNNFSKEYEQLSSYMSLIKQWKKYFSDKNIYIGYYDKLVANPSLLFDEICGFLQIEYDLLPSDRRNKLSARVNVGVKINIPNEYYIHLSDMYSQCIQELAAEEKHEPYPKKWLEMVENMSFASK